MNFESGDILLLKRRKHNWFVWFIMTIVQFFKFFILRKGLIEAVASLYHIEMAYDANMVFTQEPPKAHIAERPNVAFRVYRLKNKPSNFDSLFQGYVQEKIKLKYDFGKFFGLILDALFGTKWFSLKFIDLKEDVCGEMVSRFYKDYIKIPCSDIDPESAIPSDVDKYCKIHPETFDLIRDDAT